MLLTTHPLLLTTGTSYSTTLPGMLLYRTASYTATLPCATLPRYYSTGEATPPSYVLHYYATGEATPPYLLYYTTAQLHYYTTRDATLPYCVLLCYATGDATPHRTYVLLYYTATWRATATGDANTPRDTTPPYVGSPLLLPYYRGYYSYLVLLLHPGMLLLPHHRGYYSTRVGMVLLPLLQGPCCYSLQWTLLHLPRVLRATPLGQAAPGPHPTRDSTSYPRAAVATPEYHHGS